MDTDSIFVPPYLANELSYLFDSLNPTFRSIISKTNIFPDGVFGTNQINLDY